MRRHVWGTGNILILDVALRCSVYEKIIELYIFAWALCMYVIFHNKKVKKIRTKPNFNLV